jgi:serine/threonine-protein kinase
MRPSEVIARLHPLLDRVLELAPAERGAWLVELRTADPELARRLETALAEEDENGESLLGREVAALASAVPLAGRRVGAYTLEQPIGHGGMGTVWLARRSDGRFEGLAAIKLINLAVLDPVGRERFHREGTLLARLSHPNIARLIDAGVTDDGQPFLVLEYVEGRRIDTYCDEEHLDPTRRLELFLQALGAVAHAHANLIVHRDLKPSNILVAADGTIKLLDFGIAKLLAGDTAAAERSALTEVGGLALTPEYAAPEQALGGAVTTATDVYALGVLLYLLLAGRHPTGEGCRSAAEHLRAIEDEEPLRLAAAVSARGPARVADIQRIGVARGTAPERLERLYAGDLENIVAKTLKKNPAERYPTVQAFADDLRHYLRDEPVSARADTVRYRLGKFVRRNRTPVGLALAVLVVLLAGLVGTVSQAERAARQARQAQRERDLATRSAQSAEEQRDFALRALSRAQAVNELDHFFLLDATSGGLTVSDLLGRAADVVGRERADSDVSRVEMLAEIGQDYYLLDEDAKARELLERAYALSRSLADHSVRARAGCSLAVELRRAGELPRAEGLVRQALVELSTDPRFDYERIDCLTAGTEVDVNGGGTDGVQRAKAALALYRKLRFPPPAWEAGILTTLGHAYSAAGRFHDAAAADQEAAARLTALGRDATLAAADLYNDWGLALSQLGQPVKAEPLLRKAAGLSQVRRKGNPVLLTNLARTLNELGRLDEAARLADQAYGAARKAGDEDVVNISLIIRASVRTKQRRLADARAALAAVEPRLARALPAGHYAFAMIVYLRALIAQADGDLPTALTTMSRALAMLEANVAAKQQSGGYVPIVLQHRSDIKREMGRLAEAERDARRAIKLFEKDAVPGEPNANIGRGYLSLGKALEAEDRAAEAQRAFAFALQQLEPALGAGHSSTREARALTGRAASGAHRPD